MRGSTLVAVEIDIILRFQKMYRFCFYLFIYLFLYPLVHVATFLTNQRCNQTPTAI